MNSSISMFSWFLKIPSGIKSGTLVNKAVRQGAGQNIKIKPKKLIFETICSRGFLILNKTPSLA